MEIISIFESALEEYNWEKVFRARKMMQSFWYNKWERFEWAIVRAMESLDEEKRKNNFFPVEKTNTWWRPSRDFLITRWGCYILLKFCDGRKSEVQELKKYLEKLYLNSKIQTQKVWVSQDSLEKYFRKEVWIVFGIFIVFLFSLFYFAQTFWFFQAQENDFFVPKDLFPKEEIIQIQQQYEDLDVQIREPENIQPDINIFEQDLQNYIVSGWWDFSVSSDSNPRSQFTQNLQWTQMIESYFRLGNAGLYRESCSLLDRKSCNALSLSQNLGWFVNFWEKTQFWNEVIQIKKVQEGKYCVTYKYKLKNDTSADFIQETFQYHTTLSWEKEEITGRFCEKITKWSRKLSCPFVLREYICD